MTYFLTVFFYGVFYLFDRYRAVYYDSNVLRHHGQLTKDVRWGIVKLRAQGKQLTVVLTEGSRHLPAPTSNATRVIHLGNCFSGGPCSLESTEKLRWLCLGHYSLLPAPHKSPPVSFFELRSDFFLDAANILSELSRPLLIPFYERAQTFY